MTAYYLHSGVLSHRISLRAVFVREFVLQPLRALLRLLLRLHHPLNLNNRFTLKKMCSCNLTAFHSVVQRGHPEQTYLFKLGRDICRLLVLAEQHLEHEHLVRRQRQQQLADLAQEILEGQEKLREVCSRRIRSVRTFQL